MSLPSGSTALDELLSSLTPTLNDQTFVFTTVDNHALIVIPLSEVQMMFKEPAKGSTSTMPSTQDNSTALRDASKVTLILPLATAETVGLPFIFPCHMITLAVHSSLEAVGFMAVVTGKLSGLGIPSNPVSGFYHDHLFIPVEKSAQTMIALKEISTYYKAKLKSDS